MLENNINCCGCLACKQACTKQAINISQKENGFIYPHINTELCINCGKCKKVCPINNIKNNNVKISYYGKTLNTDIRKKSSSGGIFYECAKYILDNNGIVFGAAYDENFNINIKSINTIDNINDLMGSKYAQANTLNTFNECKHYLLDNKLVLFTGTPCIINALKTFLSKEYDNLYTIDVACHGVPSNKIWKEYLDSISIDKKPISISFRDKYISWNKYRVYIKFDNNTELNEYHRDNKYMKTFLSDTVLRQSCYNCIYKYKHTQSDLTLGDCWNINNINKEYNDKLGVSLILLNTNKGNILLNSIKDKIDLIQCSEKSVTKCNGGFKNINKKI